MMVLLEIGQGALWIWAVAHPIRRAVVIHSEMLNRHSETFESERDIHGV
jgi:hypothetical protein